MENAKNRIKAAFDSVDKTLVWIYLLALAVRLVWAVHFVGLDFFPMDDDGSDFFEYARNLAAGRGYIGGGGSQGFRPPGYPFFLAGIFYVFGESNAAVKIVQCLLSSLTPVLVYLIGLKLAARRVAVAAGFYAAIYFGLLIEPARYMSEATFTFLLTLTVFLFLRIREKRSAAIAAGIALALLVLTRPVGIVTLPLFVVWLYLVFDRRTFIRVTLTGAAACALTMAPWWIRNYRVYHAFVPVCLQTGMVIGGNSPHVKQATPGYTENMSEYEVDRLNVKQGLAARKQMSLAKTLKVGMLRLVTFFYPFLPAYDLTWFFMFPFLVIGMYAALREGNRPAYILFNFGIYLPIYFFVCATTRYRHSVAPLMILFASLGFFYLYDKYGAGKKYQAALAGWTAANLLVWLNAPAFRSIALKVKDL
ncbi:MAG TPA: glycosyltransferase family 39 protein [Elusimicrobiales bacterium]|nr:glycosyltransferase family 39 protein [Elusimicrobiales bacterium]